MLCILIYAMPCSILKARVKITESKNYLNAVRIFDFDLYWFKSESLLIAYFFFGGVDSTKKYFTSEIF